VGRSLFGVGAMASGTIGQAANSGPTVRGNLTDAHPRAGTVQQAAHDLRQPVAAVLALASAALADESVPERVRHRLEQIVTEAHWLSKIIHDMLNGPGVPADAAAVDILTLVRDTVTSERVTCAAQIILQQKDRTPRYLMAPGTRLRRALVNVLANATRAAGPGGQVKLTERADGNTEIIEVVDDGPGFGSMAAGNGTGIGLQITDQLLAECGGRLQIERLHSGQTLVRLLLPIMAHGRAAGGAR
jgi:signal transduction histidine kinase